jgi:hypothetical protein
MNTNELFSRIAQTHLSIETLETRHRDSLDFHDVGVGCLYDALQAAFDAGLAEGRRLAEAAQHQPETHVPHTAN